MALRAAVLLKRPSLVFSVRWDTVRNYLALVLLSCGVSSLFRLCLLYRELSYSTGYRQPTKSVSLVESQCGSTILHVWPCFPGPHACYWRAVAFFVVSSLRPSFKKLSIASVDSRSQALYKQLYTKNKIKIQHQQKALLGDTVG